MIQDQQRAVEFDLLHLDLGERGSEQSFAIGFPSDIADMTLYAFPVDPLVFDLSQVDSSFALDAANECHSVHIIHYDIGYCKLIFEDSTVGMANRIALQRVPWTDGKILVYKIAVEFRLLMRGHTLLRYSERNYDAGFHPATFDEDGSQNSPFCLVSVTQLIVMCRKILDLRTRSVRRASGFVHTHYESAPV